MPDTGAPWNIPYVETTDLVSDWPADSLALANAIDAGLDAAGNAGIGSNVVQTVKTDTFTTTSSTFVDVTGLTATITPTTASSKILVVAQITASASGVVFLKIAGGNSAAYVGDAAGSRIRTVAFLQSTGDRVDASAYAQTIVYLDSPSTTSPTTYSAQVALNSGGTLAVVNRSQFDTDNTTYGRGASSITVIEVAA